jgi:hypothetical protein
VDIAHSGLFSLACFLWPVLSGLFCGLNEPAIPSPLFADSNNQAIAYGSQGGDPLAAVRQHFGGFANA